MICDVGGRGSGGWLVILLIVCLVAVFLDGDGIISG